MILSQPDQSSIIWLKGGYGGFPSVPQRSEHGEVQGPIPGRIKLSVVTLDVLGPSAIQPVVRVVRGSFGYELADVTQG